MNIEIKKLNKSFGEKKIFADFNLKLTYEKVNIILGKSGGGKSTLLNIISGLEDKDSGTIEGIDSNDISYIFQDENLVPWLTIKDNMNMFIHNYYDKKQAELKLKEVFMMLHLEGVDGLYPKELSGGMRQRVNIARALLKPSSVILMDEPFKSLDYKTKYSIMKELKTIFKREKKMVIFVTHDVDEAIFMEGNIYVLGGSPFDIKGIFKENLREQKEEILKRI